MRSIYDDGGNTSCQFYEWQNDVAGWDIDADPAWPYEAGQESGELFRRELIARREARLNDAMTTLFGMTRSEIIDLDAVDSIPF